MRLEGAQTQHMGTAYETAVQNLERVAEVIPFFLNIGIYTALLAGRCISRRA